MSENSQNRQPWQVAWGEAPLKGSRTIPQVLDFSIDSPININLQFEQASSKLEFVQALFIDNSLNPAALSIAVRNTGQTITVPPLFQAYVPVLATADNCHLSFSTAGTPKVPVQYLNFPVPLAFWPVSNVYPTTQVGTVGTDASANAPALFPTLLATLAVNAARNYFEVQNQDESDIQVVMDDGTGTNQSVVILGAATGDNKQGGAYTNNYERGRIRVFGADAGAQFEMRQN